MAPTLSTLPVELLLDIFDCLQLSALMSLRRCNSYFKSLIPKERLPALGWVMCELAMVKRVLAEPELRKNRLRHCLVCKYGSTYPNNETYFQSLAPICSRHKGWFESPTLPQYLEKPIEYSLRAAKELVTCWVALKRNFCLHTKMIKNWDEKPGQCCSCNDCGHWVVDCLVRVSLDDDVPWSWETSRTDGFVIESDRPARKYSSVPGALKLPLLILDAQQISQERGSGEFRSLRGRIWSVDSRPDKLINIEGM